MNRVIRRINAGMSMSSVTVMLAGSSALNLILGVIRTKAINANFSNFLVGPYYVAFKIPDLIFYTLAGGALSVAFIPVLADKIHRYKQDEASQLTSSLLNLFAFVMAGFSLILFLFPYPILHIIADGFLPEQMDIAAQIMRFVAINPLVFSVSSILFAYQQTKLRFFHFALAPLTYNLSIIASVYLFKDSLGIVGLGVGVTIGALLHLLIAFLGSRNLKFRYSFKINFKVPGFRQVIKALPLRFFDQGITYINSIVQTRFASFINPIHGVANFENALYLFHGPVTVVSLAVSNVAFPNLAKSLSKRRPDLFRQDFRVVLKGLVWLIIPIVIVCYFCRDYMARIIYASDNREIAMIFGALSVAIFMRAVYSIISRFFYLKKDNKTPSLVTGLIFVLNIILSWQLSKIYGIVGLAYAISLVSTIQIVILVLIIIGRERRIFNLDFLKGLLVIFSIGGLVAGLTFLVAGLVPLQLNDTGFVLIAKLGLISTLALVIYYGLSYYLNVIEAHRLTKYIRRTTKKILKIV